jgi:hypothetical protein
LVESRVETGELLVDIGEFFFAAASSCAPERTKFVQVNPHQTTLFVVQARFVTCLGKPRRCARE